MSLLDQKVVLTPGDFTLRDALDRLMTAAHVRLSYTSEALPLDRTVRVTGDTSTIGATLRMLLAGASVTPIVAGPDQIVIAPVEAERRGTSGAAAVSLSPVVVTGKADLDPVGIAPIGVTVLTADDIWRFEGADLGALLSGNVPGAWTWETPRLLGVTRYGSVRGASSLGMSSPKLYIDGITVANPQLVSALNPETVDRIEVIRGPQGAALYGSDASSGVVNIVTRHKGLAGGARVRVRSSVGGASSDFAAASLTQNHLATFSGGSQLQSGYLSLGFATAGDFYTNTASARVSGNSGFRKVTSGAVITGTAQFSLASAGIASLADSSFGNSRARQQSASGHAQFGDYTIGATLRTGTGDRITHTITLGVNGYRLHNLVGDFSAAPSNLDSVLTSARGSADRTTARATTAIRFGDAQATGGTVSVSLEHSALRQVSPVLHMARLGQAGYETSETSWVNDLGLVAQFDASLRRGWNVTGGLRIERNSGYVAKADVSALPMFGASYVQNVGAATVKWRAAFGSGIRSPLSALRGMAAGATRDNAARMDIEPERQTGIEGGFDLTVGHALALQFTAYDQRATGLVQQVVMRDSVLLPHGNGTNVLTFGYQNVGAISNTGFEAQARVRRGFLSWNTSFASVASTVRAVSNGYGGDLRVGDRVPGVPARTLSTWLTIARPAWSISVGASRAYDWMEYDRLALAYAYRTATSDNPAPGGQDLRAYWRKYDGRTHLRASLTRVLSPNVSFILQGDNLTGVQRGEPDNATITPGRTLTAGLRLARF